MNLQQLEYIIALDKHRHFAKAADYCEVTQPTLSTMIQKLETELGIKIFDRGRQPIEPTALGQKILAQATQILHEVGRIKAIIDEEQHSGRGLVRMAFLPTIAPYLVPRIGDKLHHALPEATFSLQEMRTSECIRALLDDEIDIAIIATKCETPGLRDELLFFDEFYGYVSEKEPLYKEKLIRSSEVDGNRLWLLDEGHCFRDQLVRFCQLKSFRESSTKYSNGSMETFMRLVETGSGITFIPEMALDCLSPEQKKLVRPFGLPRPTREIRLAVRTDFVRSEILSKTIETITKSVPKQMLTLRSGQTVV